MPESRSRAVIRRRSANLVHGFARLSGRRSLVRLVRFVNNELRFDGRNNMERNGEADVQRLALREERPVVFDVGGHQGLWADNLLLFASEAGVEPDLHVFEPSSFSYQRVEALVGDRAAVHQLGFSDSVGIANLHVVREGSGINSLVPFEASRDVVGHEEVRIETIDSFCNHHGIDRVALVKIDVEGHDLAAIRGASSMLKTKSIGAIQFEYNWRWIDSRTYLKDVFDFALPLGYRVAKVTPRGFELYEAWHIELETYREANYLLVSPQWLDRMATFGWWGP